MFVSEKRKARRRLSRPGEEKWEEGKLISMNSGHSRASSGNYGPPVEEASSWEKKVLLGLMRVCLRASSGQSSIDSLRDALINNWPQVLPEMKVKYGKFTAFLKAYDRYFEINAYDRTVRLVSLHPDLVTPLPSRGDRSLHNSASETSSNASYGYSSSNSLGMASEASNRSISSNNVSVPSSSAANGRLRPSYASQQPSSDMMGSPRPHPGAHMQHRNLNSGYGQPMSSSSSNMHSPNSVHNSAHATMLSNMQGSASNAPQQTNKHVAFSSLEQWEQMIIFAVLKYLLQSTSGFEHFTTLQERLNDPQLAAKYVTILDLLRLFPGNFSIDTKGYVTLMDPVKARAQYPTLAAEFERRISTPQPAVPNNDGGQSHLYIAFNNATSPWEKALLKTVWTVLMNQTNHAANFPWLTTQLTRFKPWVKQNYGSLRLWAIQQSLFKFQGDTIYIPSHIAPSSAASSGVGGASSMGANVGVGGGVSVGTGVNVANVVGGQNPGMIPNMGMGLPNMGMGLPNMVNSGVPAAPPFPRANTTASGFASVSSANFSIPAPPALPGAARRGNTSSSIPPAPPLKLHTPVYSAGGVIGGGVMGAVVGQGGVGSQNIAGPKSLTSFPIAPPNSGYAHDDLSTTSRGRSRQPSAGYNNAGIANSGNFGHRRQRSASPGSVRTAYGGVSNMNVTAPVSGASTAGGQFIPNSTSHSRSASLAHPDDFKALSPSSTSSNVSSATQPTQTVIIGGPIVPKLNFGQQIAPGHPSFVRKTSSSLDNTRPGYLEANAANIHSHTIPQGPYFGNMPISTNPSQQPVSPRRAASNPLVTIDRDIPSLAGVSLTVNRTPVAIKTINEIDQLKKMVSFLSTFSVISISAELGEVESVPTKRRTNFSQEFTNTPEETNSISESLSPRSVRIHSSPPGTSPEGNLIIGSAPSQFNTANILDALPARGEVEASSQDDLGVKPSSTSRNSKNSRRSERNSSSRIHSTDKSDAGGHERRQHTNTSSQASTSSHQGSQPRESHHLHHSYHHSRDNGDVPIIHEDRQEDYGPSVTRDILVLCLSAKTNHGQSPYAPSSTMAAHLDKEVLKTHPVFVVNLRENPKFYRFLRPLLQSQSTLKIIYNCPRLSDALYTQHGIHLTNVLEIQVLHRLLWEIATLPQRFTHSTGLETLSTAEEIAKERENASSGRGQNEMSSSALHQRNNSLNQSTSPSSGSRTSGNAGSSANGYASGPNSGISVSAGERNRNLGGSSVPKSPSHPANNRSHQENSQSATETLASSTRAAGGQTTPRNPNLLTSQVPPALDSPIGVLLHYFGVSLSGLAVPTSHELIEAVEPSGNLNALRSALWPAMAVSPSTLLRCAAMCASLIDLRILLATQLSVTFTKSAMLLSQGFSHTHLPEFQNNSTLAGERHARHNPSLTPLAHDHWMDAPELFSHLHEEHGSDI